MVSCLLIRNREPERLGNLPDTTQVLSREARKVEFVLRALRKAIQPAFFAYNYLFVGGGVKLFLIYEFVCVYVLVTQSCPILPAAK